MKDKRLDALLEPPRYWSEKLPYSDHYIFTFFKLYPFPINLFKRRKIFKKVKIGAFELYLWGERRNPWASIHPTIPSPDEVAKAAWNGEIGKCEREE